MFLFGDLDFYLIWGFWVSRISSIIFQAVEELISSYEAFLEENWKIHRKEVDLLLLLSVQHLENTIPDLH